MDSGDIIYSCRIFTSNSSEKIKESEEIWAFWDAKSKNSICIAVGNYFAIYFS